ncbi:E3 ubiquitin-protein ligase TRIM39-like [Hyperolius riggenbachi]|uniref:E3 ubiquitin-protein ligase TRIM39-like n=1 Tax=Hyperolius riggenbachi TaxID=752182 RepID=UPI0035A2E6FC
MAGLTIVSSEVTAELHCSICMELYRDPVTLPCGHNFCRYCITQAWDLRDGLTEHKCAQCQQVYANRPELIRNTTLHNIAEAFNKRKPLEDDSKQEELMNNLQKLISEREKVKERVQSLEERRRKAQGEADQETMRVAAMFRDLKRLLEDMEKNILSSITRRSQKVSMSYSDLIWQLEMRKEELLRKIYLIEELRNATDPMTVLQEPDMEDLCDMEEGDDPDDEHLHDEGEEVDMSHLLHTGLLDIMSVISCFYTQEPADISIDVNSACNMLYVSNDKKTVYVSHRKQKRPEKPERFQFPLVMSTLGFTSGRDYWEVEVELSNLWRVGVCYPSIARKGGKSLAGENDKSWCLYRNENHYSVMHNKEVIKLPEKIPNDRIRVFMDYEAGQISFYALCDPIRHLHTFTAAFTEPLHAVLWVGNGCLRLSGANHEA